MNGGDLIDPRVEGFAFGSPGDDTVLLLHGWTGSPAHLRPLGDALAADGYGVVAPLLAGHGTTVQDMLGTGWRDWATSAIVAALQIAAAGKRLHLVGLSMGGCLSLLLAATSDVASVTTINAPVRVFDKTLWLSPLLRGSHRISTDAPPVRNAGFLTEYDHGYTSTPAGLAAELLDVIRAARTALPRIAAPALVIQSQQDLTVRPRSGRIIHEHIGSPDKRIVWLERSAHVATLDVERDRLTAEIRSHLAAA